MNSSKIFLAISAAAILAAISYFWLVNPSDTKKLPAQVTAEKTVPKNSEVKQGAHVLPAFLALQKLPTESPSLKLVRIYATAKDKRNFFDDARLQPEAGGAYLAYLAQSQCMLNVSKNSTNASTIIRKIALIPQDAPNRDERIAAVRKIHEPCLGFDTSPISYRKLKELIPEAVMANDPSYKALRAISASYEAGGDLSKVPDILEDAFKSGSPYALQNVLQTISAATLNWAAYSNMIDGVELQPQDAKAFITATNLIACQFGIDCSASATPMLEFCTEGKCNLDPYQLAQESGLTETEYARLVLFHNQIVNAFQNGNFKIITVQKRVFR